MARLKKKKEQQGKSMAWLTTFNDLVTNLMVFFLLLFSMGHISTAKMKDFKRALQSGLGVLLEGEEVEVTIVDQGGFGGGVAFGPQEAKPGEGGDLPDGISGGMEVAAAELASRVKGLEELRGITTRETKRGLLIRLESEIFFDSGKADINPAALPAIEKIGEVVRNVPNDIRVEGHTDNVPIKTDAFPSNWELSTARALAVVRYFIERSGISPARLSAAGYGESRPVADNDTSPGRARNRRVEILLVK